MNYQLLHQQALQKAKEYKKSEGALLEILMQIDKHKAYLKLGYPSLHVYCTKALNLTDAQAYTFCGVAKKSIEVPELKAAIDNGELHLTNARRVVPIINSENKSEWLMKATELTQKELEREIKVAFPESIKPESVHPVSEAHFEFKITISVELEKKLARVKDLLSQKKKRAVSYEEALLEISQEYIQRKDPIERAERVVRRKEIKKETTFQPPQATGLRSPGRCGLDVGGVSERRVSSHNDSFARKNSILVARPKVSAREALPAGLKHLVNLKYRGRCAHTYSDGSRCVQQRWLEVHHKLPVALGGKNVPENLVLLCSGHHKSKHF